MTAAIDHKALFDAIRRVKGSALTQADVDAINAVLLGEEKPMAWGAKVSPAFRARVRDIAEALGCTADDLMTCIAWETGRSFSPSVRNMAGSGATGLIQFMPDTARGLGTSVADLARMTAEKQLDYVEAYFRPWRGRLKNLGDLYMAILYPRAVGKPDDYVLFKLGTIAYRQNAGLDLNRDGVITRGECLVKLEAMRAEGLKPENVA